MTTDTTGETPGTPPGTPLGTPRGHPPAFDAIIGLGTNMGDKAANIAEAIQRLCADGRVRLVRRSQDYRSAPWGVTDQDWFVNAAALVATDLSAYDLLARCQAVEALMGRVRRQRWGPRIVDVDVVSYRDVVSDDPVLTLPHPRATERAFVLVPVAEIAPGYVIAGRPVEAWLADAPDGGVVPLSR